MSKQVDLKRLAEFLVKAKTNTYASGTEGNITPQRPDFNELEFKEDDWNYRDSYCGFFRAPGQEIVRFKGKPVWNMSYDGGMLSKFWGNKNFAGNTFKFLQKVMRKIDKSKPFRGSDRFQEGDYEYVMDLEGDIKSFKGKERILFKRKVVFTQVFMGGLIVHKE